MASPSMALSTTHNLDVLGRRAYSACTVREGSAQGHTLAVQCVHGKCLGAWSGVNGKCQW